MAPEWKDLLGRRIAFRPIYSASLSVSSDGRIALSTGQSVSIVCARDAVLAALASPEIDSFSLLDLFDHTQRQARAVRAPAVAHITVDKVPARALAWSNPPVLLAAPDANLSALRVLVPSVLSLSEGLWGLHDAKWSLMDYSSFPPLTSKLGNSPPCEAKRRSVSPQESSSRGGDTKKARNKAGSPDILCMSVFKLDAASEQAVALLDSDFSVRKATFVVLGSRDGAVIRRWDAAERHLAGSVQLWDKWTLCVEVLETQNTINAPSGYVGVGGVSGLVRVFSVTWIPSSTNENYLQLVPVWEGADNVLRGPVAQISFRTLSFKPGCIVFAIAVGTSVAGVRIIETIVNGKAQSEARVSLAVDAHYQSTSSVCFLPDGSVLSASMDGSVSRCKFQWDDNTEPCTLHSVIQQQSPSLDSVVSMRPSPSGLLLVSLMTRPGVRGEIGEPAAIVKKKYHYLGRPSLLGILAYPMELRSDELRNALENALESLLEKGKYSDVALSLWDVELWLLANRPHIKEAEDVLCEYFEFVKSLAEDEKSAGIITRLRKVALCIATTLERVVVDFSTRLLDVKRSRDALRISILVSYHFFCLERFSRLVSPSLMSSISDIHCESLEAKLNFVMCRLDLLNVDRDLVTNCIADTSAKLSEAFRDGRSARSLSMCEICEDLPLVAGVDEPESFWCVNGDYFTRCVKSALPCTDCVPRVCSGCGAQARCDEAEESWAPWDPDPVLCPLCNCELCSGRAEKQVEVKAEL